MKILVVSWFLPPTSTIAAVRIGNLVKFLIDRGHDIRAIGGKDLPYPQTLEVDLPPERIAYAGWMDVNAFPNAFTKLVKRMRASRSGGAASNRPEKSSTELSADQDSPATDIRIGARLSSLYTNVFNWPDANIGWLPFALSEGRKTMRHWRPDVIFASGPPFTTLLVGKLLSIWHRVPLIIEFRDRWSDDPYYPPPPWRRWVDRLSERWIARKAVAITTVSKPWAETYRNTYGKPVAVVCNGYDADLTDTPCEAPPPGLPLRIVYTGGIYPGRRDPSPLFEAIKKLGAVGEHVRVEFYGTDESLVAPSISKYSVERSVGVHSPVTHKQAIEIQRQADVLLLMQWNDPKEQGNIPGKFFEYLGALRPIMVLGLEDGVPATILAERNAGFCSNDPDAIADQLKKWIQIKSEDGRIPALPERARQGFSREEQYRIFEEFVADNVIAGNR